METAPRTSRGSVARIVVMEGVRLSTDETEKRPREPSQQGGDATADLRGGREEVYIGARH